MDTILGEDLEALAGVEVQNGQRCAVGKGSARCAQVNAEPRALGAAASTRSSRATGSGRQALLAASGCTNPDHRRTLDTLELG